MSGLTLGHFWLDPSYSACQPNSLHSQPTRPELDLVVQVGSDPFLNLQIAFGLKYPIRLINRFSWGWSILGAYSRSMWVCSLYLHLWESLYGLLED